MHLVLGIESSCDETACAVLEDGRNVRASLLFSQVKTHAEFGGVVPEVASRMHLAKLPPLIDETLSRAGIQLGDISAVAVTRAPGLIGALLVGLSYAKALAWQLGIPLVGVNHLEGHMLAARLEDPQPEFPYIALIVSGGHTAIYRIERPGSYHILGNTRDDAAGEAFDKVAKLLNLGYPGGAIIEKMSRGVDHSAVELPRPMMNDDTFDFSFSGLKTAVLHLVQRSDIFEGLDLKFSWLLEAKKPRPGREHLVPVIAAAFQAAVVDVLVAKAVRAVQEYGMDLLVVSGGVASNTALREALRERAAQEHIRLVIPQRKYCTDNAAMVGVASIRHFRDGQHAGLDMNAVSRWSSITGLH